MGKQKMKTISTSILSIFFILFLRVTASNTFVNDLLDSMAGSQNKEIFQTFHYLHQKEYEMGSEEGLTRYRNFKTNLQWNKAENEKLGETVYGITEFSDLTHEEFVENYLLKTGQFEEDLAEITGEKNLRSEKDDGIENAHYDDDHHVGQSDIHLDEHDDHHNHDDNDDHNLQAKAGEIVNPDDDDNSDDHNMDDNSDDHNMDENYTLRASAVDHRNLMGEARSQGRCGSCWAFAAIASMEGNYSKLKKKLTNFSEQH